MSNNTAQTLFPEEVEMLVNHFRHQTGNPRIESFLSLNNPNLWLIGQQVGSSLHVIAEYEKFDLELKILKGDDFF